MKLTMQIVRWIVGVLFIISGLVKVNDPIGLSYKMQEFFEVWNVHFLNDYALFFSVVLNVFEVFAGVAILIGWRIKQFSWLLLILIVFFTILTGYAHLSGKIKSCGCFGDCLPITSKQSFYKDLLLLVLILFLVLYPYKIQETNYPILAQILLGSTLMLTFFMQWHVLKHLPFVDCLPFKKGNHLLQQMKMPEGAVADSFSIEFIYRKNGKTVAFNQSNFPEDFDSTYQYIDRKDVLVKKGNDLKPAIHDFTLFTLNKVDTTAALLNSTQQYILLMVQDAVDYNKWEQSLKQVLTEANRLNIPIFLVSAEAEQLKNTFTDLAVLTCDATVLKTAARVKPTYFLMKGDLIIEKYSYLDVSKLLMKLN